MQRGLIGTLGSLATVLISIPPLQNDGLVLYDQTPSLSEQLTELAKLHAPVYNVLAEIVADSVYVNLTMDLLVTTLSIANNHGVFNEGQQQRLAPMLINPSVVAVRYMADMQELQARG